MCSFEKTSANALQKRRNEVGMKRKFTILSAILIVALTACCLFACNDKGDSPAKVDYQSDNSFFVKTAESETALTFEPILDPVYSESGLTYKPVDYRFGVIFYVGTAIEPKHYEYLGNALAKQGYLVVMPKVTLNMTYAYYKAQEEAFSTYPNVKFFVAGHSQGGGAALRRASENADTVLGAILLSPLCYRHKLLDADGNPVKDEESGVDKYVVDNLKDVDVATLLIEAEQDHVLSDEMKADAKTRLKDGYVHKVISPAAHMSFSTMDGDEILKSFNNDGDGITEVQKQSQRNQTVEYILDFVKGLSN